MLKEIASRQFELSLVDVYELTWLCVVGIKAWAWDYSLHLCALTCVDCANWLFDFCCLLLVCLSTDDTWLISGTFSRLQFFKNLLAAAWFLTTWGRTPILHVVWKTWPVTWPGTCLKSSLRGNVCDCLFLCQAGKDLNEAIGGSKRYAIYLPLFCWVVPLLTPLCWCIGTQTQDLVQCTVVSESWV